MKEFYFNLEQTKIECRAALQYLREGSPLFLCFYKKALNDISGRAISPSDLLLLAGTQHDAFSNISHWIMQQQQFRSVLDRATTVCDGEAVCLPAQ